jgi:hypothetical protein
MASTPSDESQRRRNGLQPAGREKRCDGDGFMAKGYFTGMTGVYFVAAELSARGYIVAVTSRNAPGIDIMATNEEGKRFDIQVKTNRAGGTQSYWLLSEKAREAHYSGLLYIFVNLKGLDKRPDFYVVPSVKVAEKLAVFKSSTGSTWYAYNRSESDKERWDLLK